LKDQFGLISDGLLFSSTRIRGCREQGCCEPDQERKPNRSLSPEPVPHTIISRDPIAAESLY
jgi:hypothetical protein